MSKLDDQLADLNTLSKDDLKDRWAKLTGRPVPRVSEQMLRLALAYELQAKALGGLSRKAKQRLDQMAAARTVTPTSAPACGWRANMAARVRVERDTIEVTLSTSKLVSALGLYVPAKTSASFTLAIAANLKRSGRAVRLLQDDGRGAASPEPQQHLLRLVHRARSWWGEMIENGIKLAALAREHGVTSSFASRLIRLNLLAPDIFEAIISGNQPAALDAKTLPNLRDLPLGWSAQKERCCVSVSCLLKPDAGGASAPFLVVHQVSNAEW